MKLSKATVLPLNFSTLGILLKEILSLDLNTYLGMPYER